jgi:hypothetical protein
VIGFTRQRRIFKKGPFSDVLAYTGVSAFSDIGKEDDKKLVDSLTRSLQKLPSGTAAEKK